MRAIPWLPEGSGSLMGRESPYSSQRTGKARVGEKPPLRAHTHTHTQLGRRAQSLSGPPVLLSGSPTTLLSCSSRRVGAVGLTSGKLFQRGCQVGGRGPPQHTAPSEHQAPPPVGRTCLDTIGPVSRPTRMQTPAHGLTQTRGQPWRHPHACTHRQSARLHSPGSLPAQLHPSRPKSHYPALPLSSIPHPCTPHYEPP